MKIVINRCFGGFSLSKAVFDELGFKWTGYGYLSNDDFGIEGNSEEYRKHPKLIAAIEKIGEEESSGDLADIHIVNIPEGVKWEIDEYDGRETIHEAHRRWY